MNRRHPARNKGMTLVEVLVALVLLGIGLAGVLETNFELTQTLARNRHETQADFLLQDRLALLQGAGYEALNNKMRALAPSSAASAVSFFPDSVPIQKSNDFRWNATLSHEAPDNNSRIRMEVTVKWLDHGSERARRAVGYVFAP